MSLAGLGMGIYFTIDRARMSTKITDLGVEIDGQSNGDSSSCTVPSPQMEGQCEELQNALDRRKRSQTLMVVGYSTFGVGAAAALFTQLLWKTDSVQVAAFPGGGYLGWISQF
jgi:hypothetical protein